MALPPISTPCIKVCAVDGRTSQCIGCGRTLREIASWGRLSEDERKVVMAALPARLEALKDEACAP
jgi:predicted Fe-S protein YdhL (DUF1289 family)